MTLPSSTYTKTSALCRCGSETSPGAKSTVSIMPSFPGTSGRSLVIRRVTFPTWELALLRASALLNASNKNNTILLIFCSFQRGYSSHGRTIRCTLAIQCTDQLRRREDGVGVGRPVDIHCGAHRLKRTSGGSVPNERHVIAELHPNASGRFQARVGQKTNQDDLLLAVALELMITVCVREAAGCPVFRRDDVAWLHLEVVAEGAAPRSLGEGLPFGRSELVRRRVFPVDVVARFPPMVRHMVDRDAEFAGRAHDGAKVIKKIVLFGHVLHPWPQLAALAQEVVVEVDAQECRRLRVIGWCVCHRTLNGLSIVPAQRNDHRPPRRQPKWVARDAHGHRRQVCDRSTD